MTPQAAPIELRHRPDYWYAVSFLLSMLVVALVFYLFIRQGWALLHLPDISLPSLGLTASHSPAVGAAA